MDYNMIKRLVKLVESSQIEELAIEAEGFQIRVTKSRLGQGQISLPPSPVIQIPAPQTAVPDMSTPPVPTPAPSPPSSESLAPDHLFEVKSPMVGTLYLSSSPNAPPFVKEGDMVKGGQVLCIIEAMKLMNEIESEVSGRIAKILVKDATPVEFGQTLFLIEKS